MAVNRIPLAERLERLARGYASDPAFVRGAIRTLAQMPLREYFGMHGDACRQLAQELGMTGDAGSMTYLQAAVLAGRMPDMQEKESAAFLLAVPIALSSQENGNQTEWKRAYMGNTEKIPLAERLRMAGQEAPGCPVFYGISTEEYFSELSRADTSIESIYIDDICAYSRDGYGLEMPVVGTVSAIGGLPQAERNALLYRLLVEPFVRMEELRETICRSKKGRRYHGELADILCELGIKEEYFT